MKSEERIRSALDVLVARKKLAREENELMIAAELQEKIDLLNWVLQ